MLNFDIKKMYKIKIIYKILITLGRWALFVQDQNSVSMDVVSKRLIKKKINK